MADGFWSGKSVLVTGGASFIGSHLVDRLVGLGARVVVADDFSSGRWENLRYRFRKVGPGAWRAGDLVVYKGDLTDPRFAKRSVKGAEVVFHLAATHGGRGYIATHPADTCGIMAIDQSVLREALRAGVERFCYASSACVYPVGLQGDPEKVVRLREEDADLFAPGKANADLEYGWSKLVGEMAVKAYHKQYGLKASAVRIFTAYGPRENETHAIMALIAKALVRQDPYEIWGDGRQKRNFTYVDDIVDALLLACERIEDGTPVNAGREDAISIDEAAGLVFEAMGWRPRSILHDAGKPVGVMSRAADLTRARALLGWEPKVGYEEGIRRTVEWYVANKDPGEVRAKLDRLLFERSS